MKVGTVPVRRSRHSVGVSRGGGARSGGWGLLIAGLLWFLILYLAIPADIFSPQTAAVGNAMAADWTSRLIKLGLLALSTLIVVKNRAAAWRLVRRINAFFLAFLALAALSYFWSISRPNTFARCLSLLCYLSVIVAFCVVGWHSRRFQKVVRPVVTLLLCASLVFGIAEPSLAIEHAHGLATLRDAWHGLTAQKNGFGQLAGFGTIFWLHAWLSKQVRTWAAVLFGGVSFTCLILSRSSTSLLATVLSICFLLLLLRSPHTFRRSIPYITGLFAVIVVSFALAMLDLVPFLRILLVPVVMLTGKNLTFSDRSAIWGIIKQNIDLHPLLGGGFGAYWIGPVPSSPSYVFLNAMYFYPSESHNGYLEITNDLGMVGLVVLVGFLAVYLRQALKLMKFDKTQGALYLSLFFLQAITNLTESTWLDVDAGFVLVVMTVATVALARDLIEGERRARARRALRAYAASRNDGAGRAGRGPTAGRNPGLIGSTRR